MEKANFKIQGMTCASCSRGIEKSFADHLGVEKISVNFASGDASIDFDKNKISLNDIFKKIENKGYTPVDESMQKVVFKIMGMHSDHCVMVIKNALMKLKGVFSSELNFANAYAKVNYHSYLVTAEEIRKTIEDAGYKAWLLSSKEDSFQKEKEMKKRELTVLKRKLIVGAIFVIPIVYLAMIDLVDEALIPSFLSPNTFPFRFALVQLVLSLPIVLVGYQFYKIGFKNLFKGSPNMDSLIALGTAAAYLYSDFSFYKIAVGEHSYVKNLYFETAGVIIVLILLGRYLEMLAKKRTFSSVKKLLDLNPKKATILKNGEEKVIPVEEIKVGDIVVVKPGEKIPIDGEILQGQTTIDESMITGESIPVNRGAGEKVIGATLNKFGSIQLKATRVGKDTMLYQIIRLVQEAQGSKAPIARLADIVSGYFVNVVIGIALISFLVWYFLGFGFSFALTVAVTTLIIACPCALGLATPTSIIVGVGKGAEKGILIKKAEALEIAEKVDAIVLDKTGTITEGKPVLTKILSFGEKSERDLLKLAFSVEKKSSHPLAEAIVSHAKKEKITPLTIDNFKEIPGHGVVGQMTAEMGAEKILLGTRKLMNDFKIEYESHLEQIERLENQGSTIMFLALNGVLLGVIGVADVVKGSSLAAIEKFTKSGLAVYMVTGDNKRTAKAIAKKVGLAEENVFAEVLPQDKVNCVKTLQKQKKLVAMVGDGINDAPALAQADVGLAVKAGTDVAIESADIVLMKSDLLDVGKAIELSKRTMRNIKENLFFSFFYNSVGILIAVGLFYPLAGFLLNPMVGALAMSASSVSVLLNSLRLKTMPL